MPKFHQFDAAPESLGDLTLEFCTAKLQLLSGRRTDMSWQGFSCTLIKTERAVQKEFREAARAQPREAAVIAQTPEGEAPITRKTVPPEKRRLRRRTRHRLDGIPHQFADMPEFVHHSVTKRHAGPAGEHNA
ncbi:MAG: hypothetical protein ACJ8C4_08095 [Gemmataceae bacterium]